MCLVYITMDKRKRRTAYGMVAILGAVFWSIAHKKRTPHAYLRGVLKGGYVGLIAQDQAALPSTPGTAGVVQVRQASVHKVEK